MTTPDRARTYVTAAAVAGLLIVAAVPLIAPACSPEAQRVAAPLVAASPAACALLAEGSAERDVCEASAALARALQRLADERADAAPTAPSAPEPAPSAAPAGSD